MSFFTDLVKLTRGLFDLVGGWPGTAIILLVVAVVPMLIGRPVLGPISRSAGRLKAPTRFMLSDFLWLLIQLQLSLGYCVRYVGIEQRDFFILVLGFLALATVALWAGAVSFMSRAGVTEASRRAVFILFVLPVTLAAMMATTFAVLMWSITFFDVVQFEYRHELDYLVTIMGITPSMLVVGVVALPFVAWLLRRTSFWIITAPPPSPRTPGFGNAIEPAQPT